MASAYETEGASWSAWDAGEPTVRYVGDYGYRPLIDVNRALEPLVSQLREYDRLRGQLETEGGALADLKTLTASLARPFALQGPYRTHAVSLTAQQQLHSALYDIAYGDIHLDVRQLPTHMPVYYLCRIRHDYWSAYSLVVEDLYCSPGYPLLDERFVRFMDYGHEVYFVRLSPFRNAVREEMAAVSNPLDASIDNALHDVGRHVFQAAWHDDQRPALLTARHFGLTEFFRAVELLYLCLSGELCGLRSAADENMLRFFETIYPQPAIRRFLERLAQFDGGQLNDIPRNALPLYRRLSQAFAQFLHTEVGWGPHAAPTPLYKLLFANFTRVGGLAAQLNGNDALARAAPRLEQNARGIMAELLGEEAL